MRGWGIKGKRRGAGEGDDEAALEPGFWVCCQREVRGTRGFSAADRPVVWLPQPVTPTPTLSLLDQVSHCKPQAPRGFSRVIGSGQACRCPGQGVRALWGRGVWACLSPVFPEGKGSESVKTSISQHRQDSWTQGHPRGPGPREPPSGASHSQGTPQAPQAPCLPEASPEPSGDRVSVQRDTSGGAVGPWAGQPGFLSGNRWAALGAIEDSRIIPWGDGITHSALWVLQA